MVVWQHVVLCKGTSLRMRLTIGVRSVLRCERLAIASLSQRNTLRTPKSGAFSAMYPYTTRHAATAPY